MELTRTNTLKRRTPFRQIKELLELLVELTRRAGDENPAGDTAFAVFDPLYDAGGLAALGAVGAL